MSKKLSPKITMAKTADLIPYARNSRTHDESQVAQIAGSIKEFGFTNPILIDGENGIIAGHGRVMAAQKLKLEKVPCIRLAHLTEAQKRAYVIADNKLALNAGWDQELLALEMEELREMDFDLSLTGFSDEELQAFEMFDEDLPGEGENEGSTASLADKFGIAPFSVLNAREGWWQNRKRAWLALGIKSGLGRGENGHHAAPGGSVMVAGYDKDGNRLTGLKNIGSKNGKDMIRGEHFVGGKASKVTIIPEEGGNAWDGSEGGESGTSIFDPVLCELACSWFSPKSGTVLDPFAGGSVRGIVASRLGRQYIGVELRPEQVQANRAQGDELCQDLPPVWHVGDSRTIDRICADVEADFVFSCPPYADLEVYSDDPNDLSTLKYEDFRSAYFEIIAKACAQLKDNRFACFVVGDVRDKKGNYYNFVGDTVEAFRAAGLHYYNEAILVTSVGSLPIRVGKQFSSGRKLGKTHQNVLVFVKGDGKKAAQACGECEFGEIEPEGENSDLGEEL